MKPKDRASVERIRAGTVRWQRVFFHLAWIGALGVLAGYGLALLVTY